MKEKFSNFIEFIIRLLSSSKFIWVIVALFILQALWIAFSFRYPMIYDEGTHLGVIQAYSSQISPYLTDLFPTIPFHYSAYHYLMSFPYRFIELLTDNLAIQVIFLRVINILMVVIGLFVFARLLRKISIKQIYINIGFIIFTFLPIVPLVAATINYDNMLFMLAPMYLLICIKIIQSRRVIWYDYAILMTLGSLISLVKYTFLPIFAASFIYIFTVVFRRYGKRFIPALVSSFNRARLKWKLIGGVAILIFVGIFTMEYIQNVILYGSPQPSCFDVVEREACENNSIIQRNMEARSTADQRPAVPLTDYSLIWLTNMSKTTNFSGNSTGEGGVVFKRPLPIMDLVVFLGSIFGISVLLYSWRTIVKNPGWYFLVTMIAVLFISVYLVNVRGYYLNHADFANQPRYLLTLLPILLVMIVVAASHALGRWRLLKLGALVVVLVLFTQGGGFLTHLLRSDSSWYWQNEEVIMNNEKAQKIIAPLVEEN